MGTTLDHVNTDIYGPNGKNVANLIERITNIHFYSALGETKNYAAVEKSIQVFTNDVDVDSFQVEILTKDQLPDFLESMKLEASSLWESLQKIPINIKNTLEEIERLDLLMFANDIIPEQVFHLAYDGAFKQLDSHGRTAISTFTVAGMYLTGLAVAWELLGDLPGWETNPFLPLIEVLEKGHLPLGLYDKKFYVI